MRIQELSVHGLKVMRVLQLVTCARTQWYRQKRVTFFFTISAVSTAGYRSPIFRVFVDFPCVR